MIPNVKKRTTNPSRKTQQMEKPRFQHQDQYQDVHYSKDLKGSNEIQNSGKPSSFPISMHNANVETTPNLPTVRLLSASIRNFCERYEVSLPSFFRTNWALILRIYIGVDDTFFSYLEADTSTRPSNALFASIQANQRAGSCDSANPLAYCARIASTDYVKKVFLLGTNLSPEVVSNKTVQNTLLVYHHPLNGEKRAKTKFPWTSSDKVRQFGF